MDDDTQPEDFDPEQEEIGWRVLDPDGNVVASGPGIVLEAASMAGEGED